ncbi:chorismate mutase 1 [Carex littledalei]|uniref:chorismate mutase n=1 Tax=Carex littledalei TaxID=544730 RepID=A0A833RPJ5_9POAL|nr:chorismate mutase 1 [Carex littledalei]
MVCRDVPNFVDARAVQGVRRVEVKATIFGQEVRGDGETHASFNGNGAMPVYKIQLTLVAELYGTWIMPLTKEVQVQYLLQRLD